MIKRDITETVYEYDKEGKLVKKTVTETHEEDGNTSISWPYTPYWHNTPYVNCDTNTVEIPELQKTLKGIYNIPNDTTLCNCAQD